MDLGSVNTSDTPTNDRIAKRGLSRRVTDDTIIPFGQYKGRKMGQVPHEYLWWLWENGKKDEDSCLAYYIYKRLKIKPKPSPHPVQYFAVLEHEPLHPDWEDVFPPKPPPET